MLEEQTQRNRAYRRYVRNNPEAKAGVRVGKELDETISDLIGDDT